MEKKTAVKLLSEFKTVDNVLNSADKITGKSVREKIENGREQAELSKYLATIVRDVDVSFDFDKTNIVLPDIAKVTDFLRKMQFYSFLKNIEFILKSFDKSDSANLSISNLTDFTDNNRIEPVSQNGQLGLFAQAVQSEVIKVEFDYDTKLITDTIDFEQMLAHLSSHTVISLKVFADVKNAVNTDIYGIALGINKSFEYNSSFIIKNEHPISISYYIPLGHNISQQLDFGYVIDSLKSLLENSDVKKVTHDVKVRI